jgi:hypothetical protein
MSRSLLVIIGIFILSSGEAYGKSAFEEYSSQLAGRWRVEMKGIASDGSSYRVTGTVVARILKGGTLYSEFTANFKGRRLLTKTWNYKNGKFISETRRSRLSGSWSLKKVKQSKWMRTDRYTDGTTATSFIRRINRNKIVGTGTTSDGSRSTSTYTRIGN